MSTADDRCLGPGDDSSYAGRLPGEYPVRGYTPGMGLDQVQQATSAGLLDSTKALALSDGNVPRAIELLRYAGTGGHRDFKSPAFNGAEARQ